MFEASKHAISRKSLCTTPAYITSHLHPLMGRYEEYTCCRWSSAPVMRGWMSSWIFNVENSSHLWFVCFLFTSVESLDLAVVD